AVVLRARLDAGQQPPAAFGAKLDHCARLDMLAGQDGRIDVGDVAPALGAAETFYPQCQHAGLNPLVFGCVFELLDAAQIHERVDAGYGVQQHGPIPAGIEMLVCNAGGDADEVAGVPVPALAVVHVVAGAFEHHDLLLGQVAMLARAAAGRDLAEVHPHVVGRGLGGRVDQPLELAHGSHLPRPLGFSGHVVDFPAEVGLIVHELDVTIVRVLDGLVPGAGGAAGLEGGVAAGLRPQDDLDVLLDAEHALPDAIALELTFLVVDRVGAFGEGGLLAELVLLAPHQAQDVVNAAGLRHVDLAADFLVATVLMVGIRRDDHQVPALELVAGAVVPLPALAAHAEEGRSADMAV